MPRNIPHRAQREVERTVRRLRAFCATKHGYTTAEALWAAVEKNKSEAAFFFDFTRLLRLNRKTRHSLLRLKSRSESRAANDFKEEFFNLYKILRPCTRTRTRRILPLSVGRTGAGCAEQDCCGSARKP